MKPPPLSTYALTAASWAASSRSPSPAVLRKTTAS
jgi:hypothetical protein